MSDAHTSDSQRGRLQEAVRSIRRLQKRVAELEGRAHEPIAIVGMGCRLPGDVDGPDTYWRLLENGVDAITEVPPERWDGSAYFDPDPEVPGKMYTLAGGFVHGHDQFDADLFGLSPREVAKIDPQHRLVLEVAWEALEHACVPPKSLSESATGVYLGITGFDYGLHLSHIGDSVIDAYSMTGTKLNFASGRLAYVLGLQGPALSIDTACSSSLVAIHLACQGLRRGECEMALAGGVNAMLTPEQTIAECKMRMLAPDGRCKTFDAKADGFVRGEGCGMLVLERLSTAQRQGHPIIALIRGTAVNQDGPTSGPTVPNRIAQEKVILSALSDAGLEANDIDYVEAHGTGTQLGDPIEVRALANVFGAGGGRDAPLKIGSVKTNFGHLESAAGVAGLMKATLGLQHEVIPPHLHLQTLNPAVDWASIPIEVVTGRQPWPITDRPRRAGVSSFGASGTNAHIVLEEWRPEPAGDEATSDGRPLHAYCLSAATPGALDAIAARHAQALAGMAPESLADACHTVAAGRSHFRHRLAVMGEDVVQIRQGLDAFLRGERAPSVVSGAPTRPPRIAFLLSARLGDDPAAGCELDECDAVFRQRLDECEALLQTRLDRPLRELLFGGASPREHRPSHAEPALVSLQYALAGAWRNWGIEPSAVLGHGSGEYAAACIAGTLSLADALSLAHARGSLLEVMGDQGSMAAVSTDAERVAAAIDGYQGVSVAAINAVNSVVISGDAGEVARVVRDLDAEGVQTRILDTGHALQSPLVEPLTSEFVAAAGKINAMPSGTRLISSITGAAVTGQQRLDLDYWRRQLRDVVRFEDAIRTLADEDIDVFVEIGSGATLTQLARLSMVGRRATWVRTLEPGQDDWRSTIGALASLYASGAEIDWEAVNSGNPRSKLRLPTYAFDRKRHWIDAPRVAPTGVSRTESAVIDTAHPLLGYRLRSPLDTVQFEAQLSTARQCWLDDHRVFGHIVVPATAYFEMLLAAASRTLASDIALEDIFIEAPIVVEPGGEKTVQVLIESIGESWRVRLLTSDQGSASDDAWTEHVTATCRPSQTPDTVDRLDVDGIAARCADTIATDTHYRALAQTGVEFGKTFHTVEQIRRGNRESIGWVRAPHDVPAEDADAYWLHPAALDGCLQVAREALPESLRNDRDAALVPMRLGSFAALGSPGSAVVCHARLNDTADSVTDYELDLTIADERGERLAELRGLRLARVDGSVLDVAAGMRSSSDVFEIEWRKKPIAARRTGAESARWLLFGYDDPVLDGCVDALRAEGARVVRVTTGHSLKIGDDACTLRIDNPADFKGLIDATVGGREGPWTIVHAAGSLRSDAELGAETLGASPAVYLQSLLHVAQALESVAAPDSRLLVVTSGAQGASSSAGLPGSPLWGFGRVMQTEFPRLDTVLLDLPDKDLAPVQLLAEARSDDGENQVLYRNGDRHVARLVPSRTVAGGGDDGGWRLELETPGIPDSLALRPMPKKAPGRGEVEIEVAAAGLNFRDVLVVLGVYQGAAGPLGGECAGRVVAVGEDVEQFEPGDEVIAFTGGSMASHVIADARLTWRKPAALSFEQAAALPIAFLTATYCLHELGRMKRGERVLIHGAAGGVGMAAVQLARRAGAEIFGTAGTPDKRKLIESQGVDHALDSRSLEFADRIMELTDGEGVDLVLNSLAGEFIEHSLRVIRDGGRFVEIGRTDIWDARQVEQFRPGTEYHTVLLGDVAEQDPELIQRLGEQLVADIQAGHLAPLPVQSQPMAHAADAFHLMARAGHTGKIVLTNNRFVRGGGAAAPLVRDDGAYLVTGGFGGLGLEVARWLADNGAGLVALMGRHGADEQAEFAIDAIRTAGTTVLPITGDVTCEADVQQALDLVAQQGVPLRGVLHAAGTVDDGVIAEQDWARIEGVLGAKVTGAWTLHRLTAESPLDFFVLFSSASAIFGAAGQAGYAAGNAFLDALARWRCERGQPALSVNWGPWAEVGMFVESGEAGKRAVSDRGFRAMSPGRNLSALMRLMQAGVTDAGVFTVDWSAYLAARQMADVPPLFSDLAGARTEADVAPDAGAFVAELEAAPGARRRRLMQARLREEVAAVLNRSGDGILANQGFRELGMDSLMSVELRNRLERLLGCSLVSTLAFDYPNIEALADYLLDNVVIFAAVASEAPPVLEPVAEMAVGGIDESVAELSDEEAEQALVEELNRMREADRHG